MIDISFVQSGLQLSLATTISPNSQIVNVRRPLRYRILDTLIATVQLISALFVQKKIAIYDHRNILTIIATALCKAAPSRFNCVYIGDDGMHSLIVDKYGRKHLYWRTSIFKKILLKALEKEVLSLKRIHSLKDMRSYSTRDSIFVDFYNLLGKSEKTLIQSSIFIDQPGVVDAMTTQEIADLVTELNRYNHIEIILHPRRGDDFFYKNLGFVTRASPNIEVELNCLNKSFEVVGYFSTVLLAGKRFGHKIKVLEIPLSMGEELRDYAKAGLAIIDD